jgi:hypothetical protein
LLLSGVGTLIVIIVIAFAAIVGHLINHNSGPVTVKPVDVRLPTGFASPKALPSTAIGTTVLIAGFGGDRARVTVVKVIDPSSPANPLLGADAGSRLVAIELRIANAGTTTLEDDAQNDLSVAGSNHQTYIPDFGAAAGCPDFTDGAFTLKRGTSATGCIEFQVPDRVAVKRVMFTLGSGEGPQTGVWSD